MKKVVIAPDSFKGTMSSIEVCNIVESGIKDLLPEMDVIKVPIADGGEGTVDAFLTAIGGEKVNVNAKGPHFYDIEAFYGILPDRETAVIEMAAASGLSLAGENKNPCLTTSYGTGQLIADALERGCIKIILGIGGSATNDGGIGMAAALGVKFLDETGNEIPLNGGGLERLHRIDISNLNKRLESCKITVACDVDNPLCGPNGASHVFGPQKGADPDMVKLLDRNLKHYSEDLNKEFGIQVENIPGTGAAGGVAVSLLAFTNCTIRKGIGIVLDTVDFDRLIEGADLIITGEGKIDGQSLRGKVPVGIAERALRKNIPVIAIVGSIGDGADEVYRHGIGAVFSTCRNTITFEEAKLTCRENLYKTVENVIRFYQMFRKS